MNPKRTMTQALHAVNLGEEAVAFVASGAAQPMAPTQPAPAEVVRATAPQSAELHLANVGHSPLPAERRAPVSVTFRLPAELPAALLRVAMERKLRREEPFTQQDIVAQAVREWLERNVTRD